MTVVRRRRKLHGCALVAKQIESTTEKVGECAIHKEERDFLDEVRKIDVCGMDKFGTLDGSEKAIAIPGERGRPQTAKQEGDTASKKFL